MAKYEIGFITPWMDVNDAGIKWTILYIIVNGQNLNELIQVI